MKYGSDQQIFGLRQVTMDDMVQDSFSIINETKTLIIGGTVCVDFYSPLQFNVEDIKQFILVIQFKTI